MSGDDDVWKRLGPAGGVVEKQSEEVAEKEDGFAEEEGGEKEVKKEAIEDQASKSTLGNTQARKNEEVQESALAENTHTDAKEAEELEDDYPDVDTVPHREVKKEAKAEKKEVKAEKRKSSVPFTFAKKKKPDIKDVDEGELKLESPFSKLRALIRGKRRKSFQTTLGHDGGPGGAASQCWTT